MMHENEVIHPFQDDSYVDSDDDQDCCVYENNSYGCVGANNIPPDPTMVNPENNNYPNELPEIKDEEKEDYEEFQKIRNKNNETIYIMYRCRYTTTQINIHTYTHVASRTFSDHRL